MKFSFSSAQKALFEHLLLLIAAAAAAAVLSVLYQTLQTSGSQIIQDPTLLVILTLVIQALLRYVRAAQVTEQTQVDQETAPPVVPKAPAPPAPVTPPAPEPAAANPPGQIPHG